MSTDDRERLAGLRDAIDRLDEELVRLLGKRAEVAIEIGHVKRRLDLPIHSPERELEVLRLVGACNPGPLTDAAMRRLFERIIDESRRLERETIEKDEGETTA
ncbi:MAG: chorismate mutase [Acidobacteriota bacterium]